jgi:ComF family protein
MSAAPSTFSLVSGLLDLLLPPTCAACGAGGWPLCGSCTERVAVITAPWCEACGRPWEEPLPSCSDCPPRVIDEARAPFLYEGPISQAIRGMKFSGWHALGAHLAAAMAEVAGDLLPADIVAWVPLARRRLRRRGFDQAEVLASALANRLDLPSSRLLRRIRDTTAQARKGGSERRRALQGAFEAGEDPPGTVLLVDDVLTTGATAAACARTLKRAGATRVSVLTAARSLGGPVPARCRGSSGRLGTARTTRVP